MDRAALDARAAELGISTSTRWKDETVAEKITAAEAALAKEKEGFAPPADAGVEPQGAAEGAAPVQTGTTPEGGDGSAGPVQGTAAEQSAPILPSTQPAIQARPAPVTITVTGPKRGRWRAGRHFTAEPVKIPLVDLSDDEIEMLRDDPKLSVAGLPGD